MNEIRESVKPRQSHENADAGERWELGRRYIRGDIAVTDFRARRGPVPEAPADPGAGGSLVVHLGVVVAVAYGALACYLIIVGKAMPAALSVCGAGAVTAHTLWRGRVRLNDGRPGRTLTRFGVSTRRP